MREYPFTNRGAVRLLHALDNLGINLLMHNVPGGGNASVVCFLLYLIHAAFV